MSSYLERSREIPISHTVDVVVAGGGCAGTMAAASAARNGARTLLVERYGFLGGASTAQYVPLLPIWNLTPWDQETKPLIGGLAQEACLRLDALGGTILPRAAREAQDIGAFPSIWFHQDPELTKLVTQALCEEAGVEILLHSYVADAILRGQAIEGVVTENKSGRQAILAKVVVDATGDGDVAAAAGAEFEITKGSRIVNGVERGVMPVTLEVKFANVDTAKLRQALDVNPGLLHDLMEKKAPELIGEVIFPPYADRPPLHSLHAGKLPEPYQSDPRYYAVTRPGETTLSLHAFGHNITDAQDLSSAELALRRKAKHALVFYKENIPGYANAYIASTPTQIGLRESRRILGEYVLSEDDMLSGARFEDAILRDRIGEWDIGRDGHRRSAADLFPPFDVPYRCIVPRKINGLLVAGRCISITHQAATYFTPRDIASAWALGEAAGTAAAMCARGDVSPRELAVNRLQAQLASQGFNLGDAPGTGAPPCP